MRVVSKAQREVTDRFLVAMRELKSRQKFKTKLEFAEKVEYTYSHLIRLQKNKNVSVNLQALQNICIHYNVNANFLLTGRGEIFGES